LYDRVGHVETSTVDGRKWEEVGGKEAVGVQWEGS